MKIKKSIVILTNFFDADYLVSNGYMFYKPNSNKDVVYKINFLKDENNKPLNYTVDSIALASPPLAKLPHIDNLKRIDCLCPTYNMLNDYKADKDWPRYTERYMELLKKRKPRIKEWLSSLVPNHVYFLCCWENTATGSNCHRKLYYDVLRKSKKAQEVMLPIYRNGTCSKTSDEIVAGIGESSTSGLEEGAVFLDSNGSIQVVTGAIDANGEPVPLSAGFVSVQASPGVEIDDLVVSTASEEDLFQLLINDLMDDNV